MERVVLEEQANYVIDGNPPTPPPDPTPQSSSSPAASPPMKVKMPELFMCAILILLL